MYYNKIQLVKSFQITLQLVKTFQITLQRLTGFDKLNITKNNYPKCSSLYFGQSSITMSRNFIKCKQKLWITAVKIIYPYRRTEKRKFHQNRKMSTFWFHYYPSQTTHKTSNNTAILDPTIPIIRRLFIANNK